LSLLLFGLFLHEKQDWQTLLGGLLTLLSWIIGQFWGFGKKLVGPFYWSPCLFERDQLKVLLTLG